MPDRRRPCHTNDRDHQKVALVSEPLGTPVTQRYGGDHGEQHLHPEDAVERDLG